MSRLPHVCHSGCEEDHNYDLRYPEECEGGADCDCDYCHADWHNYLTDWAICDQCKAVLEELNQVHNEERERGVHGG